MKIVFLGLSISSSWGNGHATTYRGLVRALAALGHEVWFLERDVPWYATNRDEPNPEGAELVLYNSLEGLRYRHSGLVRSADVVVVGSFVPFGVEVVEWVIRTALGATAFYDIDTPITLSKLAGGDDEYIAPFLIPAFDYYLSFTGGPILDRIEEQYSAKRAIHLPCSADPERYRPMDVPVKWTMGYLGAYSEDRQPPLERLLLEVARRRPDDRFVVAGPRYPAHLAWPGNVDRIEHLAPSEHAAFYSAQRFTVNVTRRDMVRWGWSPSVQLFEAAACGAPIVTDAWAGIEDYFEPGREIIVARDDFDPGSLSDDERAEMGKKARERVITQHTPAHRAEEFMSLFTRPVRREVNVEREEATP